MAGLRGKSWRSLPRLKRFTEQAAADAALWEAEKLSLFVMLFLRSVHSWVNF